MSAILFLSDIEKHNPYIDFNTSNTSFIRLSMVLKRMGIKNHYFFLSLLDRSLLGVNPHSPDLTIEQKAKIVRECKLNIWYYIREVVKIPVTGEDVGIPFQLHRGNLAFCWSLMNDVDTGLIMPRQTGKTYCTQVFVSYMMYILANNLDIGMYTKDATLVQDNVARLKALRDGLPKWLVNKTGLDTERKEGLSYAALNNSYKTFTSANDENGAYKLGRGATMALIHFDEIAFMNYNWIVVPTAVNSMLAASQNARRNGLPSPMIFTTTAGNPDTKTGSFALNIFESAMPFSEALYDLKDRTALLDIIRKSSDSAAPMLYLEFSYRQLGRSDEWFREAAARSKASQDDINRDLLNIWQSSSDNAILTEEVRRKVRASSREPLYSDLSSGFMVKWYEDQATVESEEFRHSHLILGMDTSENIGRDFTTMTIISVDDMRVVATARCNDSNTMEIARFVVALIKRFPGLVYIPERNNTGTAIIDYAIEVMQKDNINPYFRIYNEVVQNYGDPKYRNVDVYNFQEIHGHTRATFGFRTSGAAVSGTSRNLLYKNVMLKTLDLNSSRIYDRTLISEFCNLTLKGGRIDHEANKHDDQVISYLLACFLVFYGKNLSMYGIPDAAVLSSLGANGDEVSNSAKMEQIRIRKRIAELEGWIAGGCSYVLQQSYLRELSTLRRMVDESVIAVTPIAVSQVKAEEEKINTNKQSEASVRNFAMRFLRR